jgi:hypothetical protein
MPEFTTIHHGDCDKLGLAAELERFANDQWLGAHYTKEQAVSAIMDRFRRLIDQELELIELRVMGG